MTETMTHPIRCIQIGTSTVQGPCEIEMIHNHSLGPEFTGKGTIRDGSTAFTGKLIEPERATCGLAQ